MQKITPHLWFDTEARQAAEFYTSTFPRSRLMGSTMLQDTPSGTAEVVDFELEGMEFQALSAGPLFKINPSVSFHVNCTTKEEVDSLYARLSSGGQALMELGEYPFSERYSWVQDKFGVSWQLIYRGAEPKQIIVPAIMFVGNVGGKAEEAIRFWMSVFRDGELENVERYGKGEGPDQEGTVKYASFSLFGQEFGAMDSAYEHAFSFNEAISFIVKCTSQEEIDEYWSKLSAVPDAEACGWLKDKYGFSWQIVPVKLYEMMQSDDRQGIDRLTQAILPMKKLDIAQLTEAFHGE